MSSCWISAITLLKPNSGVRQTQSRFPPWHKSYDSIPQEAHRSRPAAQGHQRGFGTGEVHSAWASQHPAPVVGTAAASPCLGSVDVTPWRTRLDFPDCHYITVSSPSGGVGGFKSVNFNAFRTRRASGQPPLTPRRSGRSSMRNVTKRTVWSASIARSAEKLIPASSSRRSRSRCTNSARAATKICAFTRASI